MEDSAETNSQDSQNKWTHQAKHEVNQSTHQDHIQPPNTNQTMDDSNLSYQSQIQPSNNDEITKNDSFVDYDNKPSTIKETKDKETVEAEGFDIERLNWNANEQYQEIQSVNGITVVKPSQYKSTEDCIKQCLKTIQANQIKRNNLKERKLESINSKYGTEQTKTLSDKIKFDLNNETWRVVIEDDKYRTQPVKLFGESRAKSLAEQQYQHIFEDKEAPEEFTPEETFTGQENVQYSNQARSFYVKQYEEGKKKLKYFRVATYGFDHCKEECIKYALSLGQGKKKNMETESDDNKLIKEERVSLPYPIECVRFYQTKGMWIFSQLEQGLRKSRTFNFKKQGYYDSQKMALNSYFDYNKISYNEDKTKKMLVSKEEMIKGLKKKGQNNVILD